MHCVTVTSLDEFLPHRQAWDQLVDQTPGAGVFLSADWLTAWLQVYGTERDVRILLYFDGPQLVGGFPTCIESRDDGLRVVQIAGTFPIDYADDIEVLSDASRRNEVVQDVVSRVLEWGAVADLVEWSMLTADSPLVSTLAMRGRRIGAVATTHFKSYPYLTLQEDTCTTLSHVSRSRLSQLRRKRRRLEREGRDVRFTWLDTFDVTHTLMEELYRLHADRWHDKRGQTTAFLQEPSRRLHHLVAQAFARSNVLRMSVLHADDQIAAIFYGYVFKNKFYFIQHGFDPAWNECSPGSLVLQHAIECCVGERLREFDFGRGRQAYKLQWSSGAKPLITVSVALTWRGRWRLAMSRIGGWRRAARRVLPDPLRGVARRVRTLVNESRT